MPEETLLYLSPLAIVFVLAIKEFFAYLKEKKLEDAVSNRDTKQDIEMARICERLDAVEKVATNHITGIKKQTAEMKADFKYELNLVRQKIDKIYDVLIKR